ncbi:MAG: holo-ACP synthase, partial [Pseudomonadales bacterium]|nr:holo-ACP synthase [Pseudomonadales bacterium]
MIIGIGVDLVRVDRVARLHERYGERFATKILSADEMAVWRSHNDKVGYLCRRFAAKEAVGKALGTGMKGGVHFPHISITNRKSGKPVVLFTAVATARATKLG